MSWQDRKAITTFNFSLLSFVENCFKSLEELILTSVLDGKSGYWKDIRQPTVLKEDGTHLISWSVQVYTNDILAKNMYKVFQRAVAVLLASVHCLCTPIYLGDISVLSKWFQGHIKLAARAMGLPYAAVITLMVKKCKFVSERIDYSGHLIQPGPHELPGHITNAVAKLGHATTQTELCFSSRLCKNFKWF